MPSRPPRKCSIVGDGIVTFGVRLVTDFRNLKSSSWIGLACFALPVTLSTGGAKPMSPFFVWNCEVNPVCVSTPSSCSRKSMWKNVRRNSPSVTPCNPTSSWNFTMPRIASSSTRRSSSRESLPAACLSRASRSSLGRRKLPTWSARNGGLSRALISARVLHVLDLVELDVPELAVLHLAAADVDVLHDVARLAIDRHRTARAHPREALRRLDELAAGRVAAGLPERLVDHVHAVVAVHGHEVGPLALVRLHEGLDVRPVLRRIVRGRIMVRGDRAQ